MTSDSGRLELKALKSFPWATGGRREAASEFAKKWREHANWVPYLPAQPLISLIVTDVETALPRHLDETLESLRAQSYPQVEILQSSDPDSSWKKATGEWVGLVRAGDVLSPDALYQIVCALSKDPEAPLFYTHEAEVDASSKRIVRYFSKPRLGRANLLHFNPIGGFWCVRRSWLERLNGLDLKAGAHIEHDFFLRLSAHTAAFRLVPFFLYYRRESQGENPPLVDSWLRARVESHLEQIGFPATVALENEDSAERLRVRPVLETPDSRLISAIICFRDHADWTIRSLRALAERRGRTRLEVFLVNNGSSDHSRELVATEAERQGFPARVVDYDEPFNFARMHNFCVREHCRGDLLLLLNNDVFLKKGSLDDWASWAALPWIGTVGIRLELPDGGVQHAGFRAEFGGTARLARVGNAVIDDRFSRECHEVFGNSFAAAMMKRSTFEEQGGFREVDLPNGFGDTAFNFECLRRGLTNFYLPSVRGVHLESGSRGTTYEYWEESILESEYPDILQRMLREDLGYDRVPGGEANMNRLVKEALLGKLRESAPWLKPFKDDLKRLLSGLHLRKST